MSRPRLAGSFASIALVLIAVALAILGGNGGGGGSSAGTARIVHADALEALEEELGHPVFWAGPRRRHELELSQKADGSVYLRYLPPGVEAGDPRLDLLTVGTYSLRAPQAALRRAAAASHADVLHLSGGGIVFDNSSGSAYLAYPRSGLQVEVYSPEPGEALRLIRSGVVEPVGG